MDMAELARVITSSIGELSKSLQQAVDNVADQIAGLRGEVLSNRAKLCSMTVTKYNNTCWKTDNQAVQHEFVEAKEELQGKELEREEQVLRSLNCRIWGLEESEEEVLLDVVNNFFKNTTLHEHEPEASQTFRIGCKGEVARTILVKFLDRSKRDRVLANKALLKGQRI
ncbi:hypothetical protein R1flu_005370 [Riccia fluitans]|uniref:Uncharacterized protein n=1 Tax=Riccia fluitans TaxID=41844 RepID=A0ABD1YTH9_9MARC